MQDDSLRQRAAAAGYGAERAQARTRLKSADPGERVWATCVGSDQAEDGMPKHIHYNWTGYDSAGPATAKRKGIKVQLALPGPRPRGPPATTRSAPYKPKARQYERFATAAVEHFRGRVDRYSDLERAELRRLARAAQERAALYRGLYTRGYAAIKEVDPSAQVLIGETAPYGGRQARPRR